jgi:hypothetical protein
VWYALLTYVVWVLVYVLFRNGFGYTITLVAQSSPLVLIGCLVYLWWARDDHRRP